MENLRVVTGRLTVGAAKEKEEKIKPTTRDPATKDSVSTLEKKLQKSELSIQKLKAHKASNNVLKTFLHYVHLLDLAPPVIFDDESVV